MGTKLWRLCFIYILFLAPLAHSNEQCLQGTAAKGQINQFLSNFKKTFSKDLAGLYQFAAKTANSVAELYANAETDGKDGGEVIRPLVRKLGIEKASEDCLGKTSSLQQNVNNLKNIVSLSEIPVIKKSCIRASMLRQHGTNEYSCNSSNDKGQSLGKPGANGSCLTEQIVDYTWWAYHKAIYCMSDPQKPIDPMITFLKFNNESTFHMQVASNGGVGIGQLTSIAIKQVNQSGWIQKVLKSNNPNCAPFKKALQAKQPQNSQNYCQLIEPNDGFARDLIYSLAYFLETRDTLLKKFTAALEKSNIEDARFYNLGALAAYGAEGLNVQSKLITALGVSGSSYSKFYSEIKKTVPYVGNVTAKALEVVSDSDDNIHSLNDCYANASMQK